MKIKCCNICGDNVVGKKIDMSWTWIWAYSEFDENWDICKKCYKNYLKISPKIEKIYLEKCSNEIIKKILKGRKIKQLKKPTSQKDYLLCDVCNKILATKNKDICKIYGGENYLSKEHSQFYEGDTLCKECSKFYDKIACDIYLKWGDRIGTKILSKLKERVKNK